MSESQAKKQRKEQAPQVVAKKKNKGGIIFNIVVTLVIVAVVAVGGWAAYGKIQANIAAEKEATAATQQEEAPAQTVATVAESEGLSVEDFFAKTGLTDSGLTAESTVEELNAKMTIENYAKLEDKTVEEFKTMYGIDSLANDTLWTEAQMKIPMDKMSENVYGISFEEFATQNQLPPEITADMTQEEAIAIMQQDHSGHDHEGHDHE